MKNTLYFFAAMALLTINWAAFHPAIMMLGAGTALYLISRIKTTRA
jgi:hypothetical protein